MALESADLKVERAQMHIDELKEIADWYCAPDLHRTVPHFDPVTGISKMILRSEPLPPHAATAFGDAIHNLRAALDHIAYDLTLGRAKKEFISFPFGQTRDNLKATMKGGEIKTASAEARDAILNVVKPYFIDKDSGAKGNVPLWQLNKLDNIDKHRTLLLTTTQVATHVMSMHVGGTTNFVVQNSTFIGEGGKESELFGFSGGPILHTDGHTTALITIGESKFFPGEALIPTLEQLAQLVSGVIETLRPFA